MAAAAPGWRAMTVNDLDGVVAVAAVCFPDHPEDRAVFAERLRLFPAGCFVLAAADGPPLGYLIAHPWIDDSPPPLNTAIGALPPAPAVMYLHDLALSPAARGRGVTAQVVGEVAGIARRLGLATVALVAVNDAAPFWARHGFEIRRTPVLDRKLAGYGPDARYMVRSP